MKAAMQIDSGNASVATIRQANPPAPLAIETFEAFRPYINLFDPGVKTLDSCCPLTNDLIFKPVHMIPKIVWKLNKEYKRQKAEGVKSPRVFHPDGDVFRPYQDMLAKILSEKHCERAIRGEDTYFYTSGRDVLGLMYLDIDAHFTFQTDKDRASRLVRAAFPFAFHAPSGRGTNELLKVAHAGEITRFNELCRRLQAAMRKVFNGAKILCDFEVKGTITFREEQVQDCEVFHEPVWKSGSLAKLPWNGGWNFSRLAEFKACETITLNRLETIVACLEQNVDDADWAAHRQALKKAETEAFKEAVERKLKLRVACTVTEGKPAAPAPTTAACTPTPSLAVPPTPIKASCSPTPAANATTQPSRPADFAAANGNPDRLRANIDLARLYAQQIKRIPRLDEFLAFLKANGFYTGSWDQTLSARRERCEYVLRVYVAQHWDASKLSSTKRIPVNIDKWNNFCKQFPVEWVESLNCKGVTKRFHLTREDARAYFAINWTLLVERPNADGSVPFDAILAFWKELYTTGKTTAYPTDDKIAALRAVFNERGIITITDPNYSPRLKKAIRYELGPNAPGQSDYWRKNDQVPETATTTTTKAEARTLSSTQHTYTTIGRHVSEVITGLAIPPCRAGP